MKFKDWWKNSKTVRQIPKKTALFCDFGKTICEIAWLRGLQEGRNRILSKTLRPDGEGDAVLEGDVYHVEHVDAESIVLTRR